MAKLEAARDAQFMVVCRAPDVCKTPPYGVPVPYQIVALSTNTVRQSMNVKFKGNKAKTMNSRITRVMGDEPGVMGGVMSNVNMGMCRPINGSTSMRVNGHWVLYDKNTVWWMNCAGPEGPGNTVGTMIFLGATMPAKMGPDGPPPGDPEIVPEIPAEKGFIDKLTSVDGIASLAKMAPQLATMDWSNPAGVLGVFGGLAGAGGLGSLASMAGMASKAAGIIQNPSAALSLLGPLANMLGIPGSTLLNLVSTNWKNPGNIIGAASNLAGAKNLIPGCPSQQPVQETVDDGWCRDESGGHGGKPQYRSYGTDTVGGQQCVYDPTTGTLDTGKDAGTIDLYAGAEGENKDGTCNLSMVPVIEHMVGEYLPYKYDPIEYDAKQQIMRDAGVPSGTTSDPNSKYAGGISDADLAKEMKAADQKHKRNQQ